MYFPFPWIIHHFLPLCYPLIFFLLTDANDDIIYIFDFLSFPLDLSLNIIPHRIKMWSQFPSHAISSNNVSLKQIKYTFLTDSNLSTQANQNKHQHVAKMVSHMSALMESWYQIIQKNSYAHTNNLHFHYDDIDAFLEVTL